MVEDWKNFLIKIEDLKFYIIKFEKNNKMKPKTYYLSDCVIRSNNWQLTIIIINNKYIFFANNSIWKVSTWVRNTFLQFKDYKQDIITLKFFIFFS